MQHKTRWTLEKITKRLSLIEPLVYRERSPIPAFRYHTLSSPEIPPLIGEDVDDSTWTEIPPQTYWGAWRTNFMMRGCFRVPAEWAGQVVGLYLPLGDAGDFIHPECLVYVDGQPYAAVDRFHQEIILPAEWCDGQEHRLALHGWTGLGGASRGEPGTQLLMRQCAVVRIDQPTRDFVAAARVALGIAKGLSDQAHERGKLLGALHEAFLRLDTREPFGDEFYACIPAAHQLLKGSIAAAGQPEPVSILATGHAHIDVAWLWTLGQTRLKAGRTFHTVLRLMERFPDYHFTQSQPQLYEFVSQQYPALFEGIKKRIAEGRWETIGGMWVEADCNLSGGESLARQFLLGRSFFHEQFGPEAESPVLWLPDVFGYAWNLPQLIKQAGLEYFFTIKLGWNQYNRIPYDSFWWQGLDGTRVLTHFSTSPEAGNPYASTYNAKATPTEVLGTWTNFQQKEDQDELIMAFGHGDGGGGPTAEMLENLREMKRFPAAPQVHQGSVAGFFRRLEEHSGSKLPVWNGELYLELHRGTYTTQSRNKRANRKAEFGLHDAEFLASFASQINPDFAYPSREFKELWKVVCLNQFHDIIPGSSIGEVYAESQEQYQELAQRTQILREQALSALAARSGGSLLVANPTSFPRSDLVYLDQPLPEGTTLSVPSQPAADGGVWVDPGPVEPYSLKMLHAGPAVQAPQSSLRATGRLLENDFMRVELNEAGDITRIFDKVSQREVLTPGSIGNQFLAFEDRPLNWEAWDIDIFYEDKSWTSESAGKLRVVENGPLRASIEVQRRILHSDYVQRISLAYNSARLDFDTTIQWRERHILLKTAFPVDVLSPRATFEVQWGNVERPTHRNTSWDWARFETCAHKWVDLSEGGYGVSLLNDCKYGHDIHENVIRLSLLRSPTYPDPQADQGEHRFAYSLYPHAGSWDEHTIAQAYALNDPLIATPIAQGTGAESLALSGSLVSVDQPNAVIETIKRAEGGRGLVVRLYESQRRRGWVTLRAGFDLTSAWRTNLLEERQEALETDGRSVRLFLQPYQIVTLEMEGNAI